METLEFGYQLMQRRQRLQALAKWLTGDSGKAQIAIEKALAKAWRLRDRVGSEAELDPQLRRWFRDALVEGLAEPAPCPQLGPQPGPSLAAHPSVH